MQKEQNCIPWDYIVSILAKDAGAVRKVKGVVLVNTEKVDEFIESFEEEY